MIDTTKSNVCWKHEVNIWNITKQSFLHQTLTKEAEKQREKIELSIITMHNAYDIVEYFFKPILNTANAFEL